jgi:4-hydroxybutyrate CoA-transferase
MASMLFSGQVRRKRLGMVARKLQFLVPGNSEEMPIMPQSIAAAGVADLLKPGQNVFVQGGMAEPSDLIAALRATPEACADVHFVTCYIPGVNNGDLAALHDRASMTNFFVPATLKDSFDEGKIRFLPLHYSGIARYMAEMPAPDVALIQVAPPDEEGRCNLGLSVDFVPIVFDRCKTIVAEINAAMPSPPGSITVPFERFDYIVETEHPLITVDDGVSSDTIDKIGGHVAALVQDGDTFQLGIGKVPAAILTRLKGRRDLGMQGGMITDGVMALHEAGAITNAGKTYEPGKMLCGMALGSQALYDWAADRDDILYRPASVTHDTRVISQLDNFVSINSVLEVDLTGQANAETINGVQISGTGGLVDFVRGARMANNGRSIVALASTAGRGKISRITTELAAGAAVSCPRADIDYVVTEHGAARLKHKTIDERAEALIGIADPAFRDELADAWAHRRRAM